MCSKFTCVRLSRDLCRHTCAQLRGIIAFNCVQLRFISCMVTELVFCTRVQVWGQIWRGPRCSPGISKYAIFLRFCKGSHCYFALNLWRVPWFYLTFENQHLCRIILYSITTTDFKHNFGINFEFRLISLFHLVVPFSLLYSNMVFCYLI